MGDPLKEILDMSVNKKPPFIKGSSDKGFKDAILFLSLLKFAEENKYDKYVLFSEDNGFSNKDLHLEFSNYLKIDHDKLEVIKNKGIATYINNEFKLFTDLKEHISDIFFKKLEKMYAEASAVDIDFSNYDIDSFEIIEEDTVIHQYGNNEFEVEFYLDIWIYCPKKYSYGFRYLFDDEYTTKTINQSEIYLFRKENDEWVHELNSRVYDIDFD